MNFIPLIRRSQDDFLKEHSYTYCEMLCSVMKMLGVSSRGELYDITDEDVYKALQSAKEFEKEDK